MRILAVSHLFPNSAEPRYGIFVARQLEAMIAEGAEIELIVPRLVSPPWLNTILGRPPRMNDRATLLELRGGRVHGVRYFARPGRSFKRRAGSAMHLAAKATAKRLHQERPFDVVYGTDWFLGVDAGLRIARDLGLPSAGLAIGEDINVTAKQSSKDYRHFVEIAVGLSTTMACGDGLAQEIDSVRQDGRTLSVYGVVDLERFTPVPDKRSIREKLGLPVTSTLVTYVGYLWKRKGLFELLDAFEQIAASREVSLVICGDGEDAASIHSRADSLSTRQSIRFQGVISPAEVPEYLQASDVFVLPSYAEGVPNAVMEAMACGVPVVSTTVGGIPQAVGNDYGAVLVEPRDTAALAGALSALIDDREQRRVLGMRARERAEQAFGARPNARRILDRLRAIPTSNGL